MAATRIMEADRLRRTIRRLAYEIVERNRGTENVVLVGIRSRGSRLAELIAEALKSVESRAVPTVSLDVTPFRDDRPEGAVLPAPGAMPDLHDRDVIVVDDVLFTGRTARAALDAVVRNGRPRSIQLVALVDRGHREYPIQPDYVGLVMPTKHRERVIVDLGEEPSIRIED